ncbi:DUF1648 domain-containing protein [Streptomyces sp. NPDC127038]|uniref:DUF1648 domain-containing protein n=1 Tax=Streptomyces sp. NPDC127038 TaxID=3347114 RepID=UPI0036501D7C
MTTIRRCALAAGPFAVAAAVYAGLFRANRDRLPGRMATHFALDGTADGFMSRDAALWSGIGLTIGVGVLFTVLAAVATKKTGARLTAALGAGTAVLLGCPLIATVVADADAGVHDPAGARLPVWLPAVLLLLVCAATGALIRRLAKAAPRPSTAPPTASLPLVEGEVAAWSRTVVTRALLVPAAAVTLGGLLTAVSGPWQVGLPLFVLGLACAPIAAVRVTVDRRGLTVASTMLPRPRLAVPLDAIADAGSARIDAMGDFGGWGYRILPHRRGVVLRSGEALSVRTAKGREYVVTVDDATTAAALLNGLVNRRAEERSQEC